MKISKSVKRILIIAFFIAVVLGTFIITAFLPDDQAVRDQIAQKIANLSLVSTGSAKYQEVLTAPNAVHVGEYLFSDDLFRYTIKGETITSIIRKQPPEEAPSTILSKKEMDDLAMNLFQSNFAAIPLRNVERKTIRDYSGLYMIEINEMLDAQTQSGLKAMATFTSEGQLMDMTFITSRIDKSPTERISEEQALEKAMGYVEAEFMNKPTFGGEIARSVDFDQSADPYGEYEIICKTFNNKVFWFISIPIEIGTAEKNAYKTRVHVNIDISNGDLIGGIAKAAGYTLVK